MIDKNLSDALFEKKSTRKKFIKLFLEIIRTGESLIVLLRQCEPARFESIHMPADELIEQWETLLRKVVFLAFGKDTTSN